MIELADAEGLLGVSLAERPLLQFGDLSWRPSLGSKEEGVAIHIMETDELGNSISKRIQAALMADASVYVALPQGPIGLARESQEFLLANPVGIMATATDLDDELSLHPDFAGLVVRHGVLLGAEIASETVSNYLQAAFGTSGDERGRALERALALATSQVPGWRVRDMNYRNEMEELDVVVANNSAKSPWNGSSFVLLEAKNWSSNVDRAEYDAFHMKVKERGGACRVGLFIAAVGFSSGFYERATHHGTEGFSIVPVLAPRLAAVLAEGTTVEEALARRVEQVVLDRQWEE